MRVAVLPWGDPSRWRYVEYCLQGDPERCAAGFSTLELLFKLEELRPDLALVLVPDTLALAAGLDPGACDYGALVERVRSYVERYLCVGEAERGRVRVVVLPGVISGESVKFRADPGDTRLLALYEAYGSFVDAAGRGGGALEVLLDTTHGVNYFTIAVREAVFEAAAAAAAALGDRIIVRVFNADPVAPDAKAPARSPEDPCRPTDGAQPPRVAYNLLYEELVRPWDLSRYVRYGQGHGKLLTDPRDCELGEGVGQLLALSKRLVSSFRVGALLELVELTSGGRPEVDSWSLWEALAKARSCWESKARVSCEDNTIRTEFTRLEDGFRLLVHAHAILSGTLRLRENCGYARWSELKSLRRSLLSGSEVTRSLVDVELGIIERIVESGKAPGEWTAYSRVSGREVELTCEEEVDGGNLERLRRNFIAHVGLLEDLVELKRVEEPGRPSVLLRVRPGCWPLVERILDAVFRDLVLKDRPRAAGPPASRGSPPASPPTSSA